MKSFWQKWQREVPQSDSDYEKQVAQLRAHAPIPVMWMFGKTGSGKSSIIHSLTGADEAIIGEGYRPETKTSRRFDFPDATDPLLTFLDTRGLGEARYDPTSDIDRFSASTQLMMVTVKVTDHALVDIIEPLRRIRRSDPQRPVLLVLTCLHEATPGIDLSDRENDPFNEGSTSEVPDRLRVLIEEKKEQFNGLFDHMIPVDLTRLEDGFADPDFGGDRLRQAILSHLPQAYRQALLSLYSEDSSGRSNRRKKARWQIMASCAAAGLLGAIPVPWADIPGVLGIQSHLAMRLAKIYEQELTPARWALLSSVAGSHIAMRMALRGVLKFVPIVGMAAGAAGSFAFTYALGMSWDWYFADLRAGNVPDPDKLREIFAKELQRGHELWRAQ
ncbi:MAG: GTPase [Pirellulaceae bacterium]